MRKRALVLMLFMGLSLADQLSAGIGFGQADYVRTLNRSASVGTPDAMFFNPAGAVRMADGLYIHIGGDIGLSTRSIQFDAGSDAFKSKMYLPPPSGEFGFMYKRAGSAFYMTILPTLSDGLKINDLPLAVPGLGVSTTGYNDNFFNYQIAFGAAFSFSDIFAMSFSGQIISHNYLGKTRFEVATGTENYNFNSFGLGASFKMGALLTPLPWMAISLNVDTGGPLISGYTVKSDYTGAGVRPSLNLGLAQQDGFRLGTGTSRADLGFGFNINDVVVIQLTGLVEFNLFHNNPAGIAFNKDRITYSYGGGIGFDFNFGDYVTWGFGALYRDDSPKDKLYYDSAASIRFLRMQSLTVGTGFRFGLGDVVDLNLSAAYPLYFSTNGGFKFSKIPNSKGGYIESSDILISLGLTVKMLGLY